MIFYSIVNFTHSTCVFGGHVFLSRFYHTLVVQYICFNRRYTVKRLYSLYRINFKHPFRICFALLVYIYHTIQRKTRFCIKGNFYCTLQSCFHLFKYQDGPFVCLDFSISPNSKLLLMFCFIWTLSYFMCPILG